MALFIKPRTVDRKGQPGRSRKGVELYCPTPFLPPPPLKGGRKGRGRLVWEKSSELKMGEERLHTHSFHLPRVSVPRVYYFFEFYSHSNQIQITRPVQLIDE